jgi:hypothetical protein
MCYNGLQYRNKKKSLTASWARPISAVHRQPCIRVLISVCVISLTRDPERKRDISTLQKILTFDTAGTAELGGSSSVCLYGSGHINCFSFQWLNMLLSARAGRCSMRLNAPQPNWPEGLADNIKPAHYGYCTRNMKNESGNVLQLRSLLLGLHINLLQVKSTV